MRQTTLSTSQPRKKRQRTGRTGNFLLKQHALAGEPSSIPPVPIHAASRDLAVGKTKGQPSAESWPSAVLVLRVFET